VPIRTCLRYRIRDREKERERQRQRGRETTRRHKYCAGERRPRHRDTRTHTYQSPGTKKTHMPGQSRAIGCTAAMKKGRHTHKDTQTQRERERDTHTHLSPGTKKTHMPRPESSDLMHCSYEERETHTQIHADRESDTHTHLSPGTKKTHMPRPESRDLMHCSVLLFHTLICTARERERES